MNNEQSRNETLFTTNNMNEVIKKIAKLQERDKKIEKLQQQINGHHNVDNSYLNINVDNKNHHNHNVPIVQVIESSSSSSFGNQPYYGQKRKLKKNIQPEIEDKNLKLSEVQIWFRQINESPQAQEAAKKIQGWFRKIRGRQQDHFPDKTYNDMRDFCRNVHDWEFSMKQKGKNVVRKYHMLLRGLTVDTIVSLTRLKNRMDMVRNNSQRTINNRYAYLKHIHYENVNLILETLRCSTKHKEANIEWLNSKLQEAEDIIDQVSEWMNECS
ncbi:hypothetical protein GLOIN_2v1769589 [Rhizophagus clarus]|uniref:Uncharacterized protein n=1 Tax=Rhizophagus clarus TaxID=94130 RepID=A0A8H3QZG6_9GLOM|nr:hypothetical protein GLOIN_2v1769589 [Rhizophagus clarus]